MLWLQSGLSQNLPVVFTCGLSLNVPVDIFHVTTRGGDGNQPIWRVDVLQKQMGINSEGGPVWSPRGSLKGSAPQPTGVTHSLVHLTAIPSERFLDICA